MMQLKWNRLLGQNRIKEVLSSAFSTETLGHAYLLCGDTGAGTFACALEMAMALHCGNDGDRPCCTCGECRKVLNSSHPDVHIVMPLSLQKEHKGSDGKITDAGWDELGARVKERINDPYFMPEYTSLPAIPVEWIREVMHAIRRGAVEKGKNVVIIDGIDTMQQESANAMLKTLEEPPAGTILFLCTSRLHAVLPTIVSRCQILRFAGLAPELLREELVRRCGVESSDPRLDEVIYTGSLGKALQLFENADAEDSRTAAEFLDVIEKKDISGLFELIDRLNALNDYSIYENLFVRLMYGIRNAFFTKIGGTENYIMGDNSLAGSFDRITTPQAAEVLTQCCETAISRIRSRANISLVLVNFAFSVMELLHEQKQ